MSESLLRKNVDFAATIYLSITLIFNSCLNSFNSSINSSRASFLLVKSHFYKIKPYKKCLKKTLKLNFTDDAAK